MSEDRYKPSFMKRNIFLSLLCLSSILSQQSHIFLSIYSNHKPLPLPLSLSLPPSLFPFSLSPFLSLPPSSPSSTTFRAEIGGFTFLLSDEKGDDSFLQGVARELDATSAHDASDSPVKKGKKKKKVEVYGCLCVCVYVCMFVKEGERKGV